jgi:hypothetical protein
VCRILKTINDANKNRKKKFSEFFFYFDYNILKTKWFWCPSWKTFVTQAWPDDIYTRPVVMRVYKNHCGGLLYIKTSHTCPDEI